MPVFPWLVQNKSRWKVDPPSHQHSSEFFSFSWRCIFKSATDILEEFKQNIWSSAEVFISSEKKGIFTKHFNCTLYLKDLALMSFCEVSKCGKNFSCFSHFSSGLRILWIGVKGPIIWLSFLSISDIYAALDALPKSCQNIFQAELCRT